MKNLFKTRVMTLAILLALVLMTADAVFAKTYEPKGGKVTENILTKAQILNGKRYVEPVEIPELIELDGKFLPGQVNIRPLDASETAKVEAVKLKGVTAKGKAGEKAHDLEYQADQMTTNVFESKCLEVAYALSTSDDEKWTVGEVKMLRPRALNALHTEVVRLSGGSPDLDSFRRESTGDRTDEPDPDRLPAGADDPGTDGPASDFPRAVPPEGGGDAEEQPSG